MKNGFNGREAFVTLDDCHGRADVRVQGELMAEIEPLIRKDVVWVVDGGIAYDDFNGGVKMRANRVQLLEDYRARHARALRFTLNGNGTEVVESLLSDLQPYRASSALPVVFQMQREGYEYELKTNGEWSVNVSEQCVLDLNKRLKQENYQIEY